MNFRNWAKNCKSDRPLKSDLTVRFGRRWNSFIVRCFLACQAVPEFVPQLFKTKNWKVWCQEELWELLAKRVRWEKRVINNRSDDPEGERAELKKILDLEKAPRLDWLDLSSLTCYRLSGKLMDVARWGFTCLRALPRDKCSSIVIRSCQRVNVTRCHLLQRSQSPRRQDQDQDPYTTVLALYTLRQGRRKIRLRNEAEAGSKQPLDDVPSVLFGWPHAYPPSAFWIPWFSIVESVKSSNVPRLTKPVYFVEGTNCLECCHASAG